MKEINVTGQKRTDLGKKASKHLRKQKEIRNFQNSLQAGDHVVTGGGIYGTVKNINLEKNTVEVEIARGVNIVVDKSYVFADANSPMRQA